MGLKDIYRMSAEKAREIAERAAEEAPQGMEKLNSLLQKGLSGTKDIAGSLSERLSDAKVALEGRRSAAADGGRDDGLKELTISDDIGIEKGGRKVFRNRSIRFGAEIECAGTLAFEHCVLHCGGTEDGGIHMQGMGTLILRSCKIVGHGSEGEPFVELESTEPAQIAGCEFIGAKGFLGGIGDAVFKNCNIVDGDHFIDMMSGSECRMTFEDCKFVFSKGPEGDGDEDEDERTAIRCYEAEFTRCVFTGPLELSRYISMFPQLASDEELEEVEDKLAEDMENGQKMFAVMLLDGERCRMTHCTIAGVSLGDFERLVCRGTKFENVFLDVTDDLVFKRACVFIECSFEKSAIVCGKDADFTDCRFSGCVVPERRDSSCEYRRCKYVQLSAF